MKNNCPDCGSDHTNSENGVLTCWECGLIFDYEEMTVIEYPEIPKDLIEMEKIFQGLKDPDWT